MSPVHPGDKVPERVQVTANVSHGMAHQFSQPMVIPHDSSRGIMAEPKRLIVIDRCSCDGP